MQHSIETESRTRKYVKGCWFLLFARKYKRQLLDPGLVASKKKNSPKAGQFIGKKLQT